MKYENTNIINQYTSDYRRLGFDCMRYWRNQYISKNCFAKYLKI